MICKQCDFKNSRGALHCAMCGSMLVNLNETAVEGGSVGVIGHSYRSLPTGRNPFYRHTTRASFFLITCFPMVCVLLLGLSLTERMAQWVESFFYLKEMSATHCAVILTAYGLFVHAFLIGVTASANDAPFLPYFVAALAPPLWPVVYARLEMNAFWKPYFCLFLDAAILAAANLLFKDHAWVIVFIGLVMLPFVIYHLLGARFTSFAQMLGYNGYVAVAWVCLMPVVFVGYLMVEIEFFDFLAETIGSQAAFPSLGQLGENALLVLKEQLYFYRTWGVLYVGVISLFWMKAAYEILLYPLPDVDD